jgi:hypothetical protein
LDSGARLGKFSSPVRLWALDIDQENSHPALSISGHDLQDWHLTPDKMRHVVVNDSFTVIHVI